MIYFAQSKFFVTHDFLYILIIITGERHGSITDRGIKVCVVNVYAIKSYDHFIQCLNNN